MEGQLQGSGSRKERRRTQGREAQRRFRMRKEQAIHDLQADNDILQDVIEEMSTTILQLGGRLWDLGLLSASTPLAQEWKQSLEKVIGLAEKSQRTGGDYANEDLPFQAGPSNTRRSSTPTIARPDEDNRPGSNPTMMPTSPLAMSSEGYRPLLTTSLSESMIRMPTLNPVMADDYLDPALLERTDISFAKRLCRTFLIRTYQCLEVQKWGHEDVPLKDWMARTTKYSYSTTSNAVHLSLTRAILKSLMSEDDSEPSLGFELKRLRLAWHFDQFGLQRRVGLEARQRMTDDGIIWEDLLDAEQVEAHLTSSGVTWTNERYAQLRLDPDVASTYFNALTTPEATHMPILADSGWAGGTTATIDVEALIDKLLETSLCLGSGVGFWRHRIDEALVSSTVRLE
ncbi:hypothetical protein BDV97DRAFT_403052 [Delphinella strobiligena]|nr:hypothetical protein BDV97DRAFT_403052 [Delphinella strobiligena]